MHPTEWELFCIAWQENWSSVQNMTLLAKLDAHNKKKTHNGVKNMLLGVWSINFLHASYTSTCWALCTGTTKDKMSSWLAVKGKTLDSSLKIFQVLQFIFSCNLDAIQLCCLLPTGMKWQGDLNGIIRDHRVKAIRQHHTWIQILICFIDTPWFKHNSLQTYN